MRMKTRKAARPRPWAHRSETVRSKAAGSARITVISDTHSHAHPDSVRLVAESAPDAILHAGDIGDPAVLAPFADLAPLIAVRGNIDARHDDFPDSIDIHVVDETGAPLSTLLLQHICLAGPKLRSDAARNAEAHGAQVVVCGHSHIPFIGRDRGRFVFNPGSIGPRRFALPIVFGTMLFRPGALRLQHVSCETGQPWTPAPTPQLS